MDVGERWEKGVPHDPRSEKIARGIAAIDWEQCSDSFCWKFGGDGDNGETLMYLLDVYFEREDASAEPTPGFPPPSDKKNPGKPAPPDSNEGGK